MPKQPTPGGRVGVGSQPNPSVLSLLTFAEPVHCWALKQKSGNENIRLKTFGLEEIWWLSVSMEELKVSDRKSH